MEKDKEIIDILNNIQERLDKIEEILYKQQLSTNKMDKHIDFVDDVYNVVRNPFCKVLSLYHGSDIKINKQNALKE